MGSSFTLWRLCTLAQKPPKNLVKSSHFLIPIPNNGETNQFNVKKCLTSSKLPLPKPPRRLSKRLLRKLLKRRPKRLFQPTVPRPKMVRPKRKKLLRPRTARLRPQKTRTKMAMKTIRKKPIRTQTCPCLQKTVMPKLKPLKPLKKPPKPLKKIKKLQPNVRPANLKLRHYQFQLKKSPN